MSRSPVLAALGSLLLAHAAAHAQEGQRLLQVLDSTTAAGQSTTNSFAVPTTEGRWFLTVSRTSDKARGAVTLDGVTLFDDRAFQSTPASLLRAEVRPALTSTLQVSARQGDLRVLVEGVVPDAHAGPLQPHVIIRKLFEARVAPQGSELTFAVPAAAGLFALELRNEGAATAFVDLNGRPVVGPGQVTPRTTFLSSAVALEPTNVVSVRVMGNPGSAIRLEVVGYVVDTDGPAVTVVPSDGAWTHPSRPLELTFSDAVSGVDLDTLSVLVNGVECKDRLLVTATGATAPLSDLPVTPGRNDVVVLLRDQATNPGGVATHFNLDVTPPSVDVTPGDGEALASTDVPITIDYWDDDAGLALETLRVLVDGQDRTAELEVGGVQAAGTLTLAPGPHTLTVVVADVAGLVTTATASFVVDVTAPILTFLSPAAGTPTGGRDEVVIGLTDDLAGLDLDSLRLSANGVDGTSALIVDPSGDTARARLGAISDLGSGSLRLVVTARDRAGNEGQATLTLEDHDGTPPLLVLDPPRSPPVHARRTPTTVSVYFTDDRALAPETLRVWLDGQDVTDTLARPADQHSAQGTFTLGQGLHELTAEIEDARGSRTVVTSTFVVDDTPPEVVVVAPPRAGPRDRVVLTAVDHGSGLGAPIQVLVGGVDVSAYAQRDLGVALLDLAAIPAEVLQEGVVEVEGVVVDRAGNVGRGVATLTFDRTGPTLVVSPADGAVVDDERPTLVVTWSDAGAGPAPATFAATLNGADVPFVVGSDGAEATPLLADGEHVLTVALSDEAGNRTETTVRFVVRAGAAAYELSLQPGAPSAVLAHTENDLVVRAVTLSGRTSTAHAGTVLIEVSDGLPPLHGIVASFDPARDQGVLTIPRLAFFRSAGALTITARSLPPGVAGALSVQVVVSGPLISSDLPAATSAETIDVEGVSFPGQQVFLVIDGNVVAQTIAGPSGAFRFVDVALAEGERQLAIVAIDPSTGLPHTSPVVTIVVLRQAPPAPTITIPGPGAVVSNLITVRGTAPPGSVVTIREGSVALGHAPALDGAFTIPIRLTTGEHVLVAVATDAAGNTSAPSPPVRLVSGTSPVWGRVLDGEAHPPQILGGLTVRLAPDDGSAPLETATDTNGRFVFADVAPGRAVLSVNAPRRPGFARLDLPALALVDRAQGYPTIVLPRVPVELEIELPVDGDGLVAADTWVESPRVQGARLGVPAGTRVTGEGPPRLAIRPVDPAHTPLPFPRAFRPRTLWELSPSGLAFSPPLALRLPNLDRLAPGSAVPLLGLKAAQGGWVELGLATVDATGAFLETGPVMTGFSLVGVTSPGELVSTQVELRLSDPRGAPLEGATVTVDGQPLATAGGGLYRSEPLLLPRGRPVRALATLDLPDGRGGRAITLVGESLPVLPVPGGTALPELPLGLVVSASVLTGGGQPGEAPVSINTPAAQGGPQARVGLLHLFFPEPDAPPFVAVAGVPETSAAAPTTARFVPFTIDVSDPNAGTVDVVSVEYSIEGSAYTPADVVPGDPLALLSSPAAGKRHVLLWDLLGPGGVGLVDLAQVVLRVTVRDPDGHTWTSAPSAAFFVRTGEVVVSPAPLDLGEVERPVDASRTVTITNAASSLLPVEVRSLTLGGADASRFRLLDAPGLPRVLGPGEVLTVDLAFDGTSPEGTYSALLVLETSVPGPPRALPVQAASVSPTIVVTPDELDLGSVRVGEAPSSTTVTVSNASARRDLVVSSSTITGDAAFASDLATPLLVPPGATRTFTVTFAPTTPGDLAATLALASNDPDAPIATLRLRGRGERPILQVAPTAVAFGAVLVGTSATRTLTVHNAQPANRDLVISAVSLTDDGAGAFSVAAPVTPLLLPPGASVNVQVRLTPAVGPASGRLVIETDDPDTPTLSVPLEGAGVETLATLAPAPFDFGLQRLGAALEQEFLLRNAPTATADLTVTGLTGPSSVDFTLVRDEATGRTLAPGESATFVVRFEAARIGSASDTLVVSFAEGAPIELALGASAGLPRLIVSPPSADLGEVRVGAQRSAMVTVENALDATYPLTVAALLSPPGAGVFQITSAIPSGRVLQPGEGVAFGVTFSPVGADTASVVESVRLLTDDPTSPALDIPVAGRGLRPFLHLESGAVDFGVVTDGGVRERRISIQNGATANVGLVLAEVFLGSDASGAFSLASDLPDALAPGAAVDLVLRYTPRPGSSDGSVVVRTDDPDRPLAVIPLRARGELPVATTTDALHFGLRRVGEAATLLLSIENDPGATADLAVQVALVEDGGLGAFGLGSPQPATLVVPPGQSGTVEVLFASPREARFTGALQVTTNDPRLPTALVALSGEAGVPRLDLPTELDLGGVRVASSASGDLTIANLDSATFALGVAEIALVDSADGVFALVAPAVPAALAPGTAISAQVTFSPGEVREYRGVALVASDDDGSPHVVVLRGRGALPELIVATSIDVPATRVGSERHVSLPVRNASPDLPLRLTEATVSGTAFRLLEPLPPAGLSIPPQGEASLTVAFEPTSDGVFAGAITLTTDDPRLSTVAVALSGQGTYGALVLTLLPGPAAGETSIAAGSLHVLRARAVDVFGDTDTTFTGLVELRATDRASPLDGLLLLFTADDHGTVTVPLLPAFLSSGAQRLVASLLLEDRTPELGALDVFVTPAERGQAYVVLSPHSGPVAPGAEVLARVFVDCGPDDGDPATLHDTLGAYDVRLLLDPRALEIVDVAASPALGGPSFRWLGGEARFMHVVDQGSLTFPVGPDPTATGLVELATVRMRVRDTAPAGRTPVHLAVDLLATAEAAAPHLSPLGRPGPRLGLTVGEVAIAGDRPPPALHVLGGLPRAGEAIVGPLQELGAVQLAFSRALDPATVPGGVRLLDLDGAEVAGSAARAAGDPNVLVFVPAAPLAPGQYSLQVGATVAGLDALLAGPVEASFRIGTVPTPRSADLDADGEVTVTDVAIRRDRVVGRSQGEVPIFPPLFLDGVGSIVVREGEARTILVRVVDLQGAEVLLSPDGLPDFVRLTRLEEELFELTIEPTLGGSGGVVNFSAGAGGETSEGQLTISFERVNTPPGLVLVEPKSGPFIVLEGDRFELVLEAIDPDLHHPTAPDRVTFLVKSPPLRNLSGPLLSGSRQERATFVFEPDFTQAGVHPFVVEVSDHEGATASFTTVVEVRDLNRPPELSAIAPVDTDTYVSRGDRITLDFVAVDPDGDPVTIALQGAGAADLAREVSRGRIRIDEQHEAPGRLTIRLTILEPLSRHLFLSAVASDGRLMSASVSRNLLVPLTVASYSAFALQTIPVGLTPEFDRHVSKRFSVTATTGTFAAGNDTQHPDRVWLEVGDARATNVERIAWSSSGQRVLEVSAITFTDRLAFVAGALEGYVLATELIVQGQPVVRRAPLSFVAEPLTSLQPSVSGVDSAPSTFRGTYSISIAEVTTVTIPVTGTYRLEGNLVVWRGFDYSAIPTCSSVVFRFAGEALVSDGGFKVDAPPPEGWTWNGFGHLVRPVAQDFHLTEGTYQLEILASGTVERIHQHHVAAMGASFSAVLELPKPTVTLVSASSAQPGDSYLHARLRVTRPHLVRRLVVLPTNRPTGWIVGQQVVQPVPDDPREPIEVDVLFRLGDSDDLRLAGEYAIHTGGTAVTTPEVVIPTPRGASGRASHYGLYRPRATADGGTALEPAYSASILPEGVRPEDQPIGRDSPYVMYVVYDLSGLPPEDADLRASLSGDGTTTPRQHLPTVDASGAAITHSVGHVPPLEGWSGQTTRYRLSLPIFFSLRAQPAGTLTPVQVLGDRIVVSIGVPSGLGGELDPTPRSFPLPGYLAERLEVELRLRNQGAPTDTSLWASNWLFTPGLLRLSHEHDSYWLVPRGELEGSLVECEDVIQCWFPFPRDKGRYTLYLDDGDGAPLVALEPANDWYDELLEFNVRDLVVQHPELTPGRHRVRLFPTLPSGSPPGTRPAGEPLLEATFELVIANRAMFFKTDLHNRAPDHCDGATPGDPHQLEVRQGDLALDDGEGPGTARAGGSVLLATGEETLDRVDMVIPGRGMDFVLSRRYRSRGWYNGPLGHSWDFNWNEGLFFTGDGHVYRQNGRSRISQWTRQTDGSYTPEKGHFSKLIRMPGNPLGLYVLRETDGVKRHYRPDGRLSAVQDRHGNTIRLLYRSDGTLERVIDTLGREIHFHFRSYPDPVKGGTIARLHRVEDFTGREVEYVYDAPGDLVAVKAPQVSGEDRRVERYEYWSEFSNDNDLAHNLKSIATPTGGGPTHTLFYGTNRADPLTYDKVIRETIGQGTGVGGTRHFSYRVPPPDPTLPGAALEVEVVEPNGETHLHLLDKDGLEVAVRHMTRPGLRPGAPPFYETRSHYNVDGLLAVRIHPEGNRDIYTYGSGSRAAQRNVIEHRRVAGPRGASTPDLVTRYTYEPLYSQLASVTDPRRFAPSFVPPLPVSDPDRYTIRYLFDYQESSGDLLEAQLFGINLPGIPRGLGDQNGDGVTTHARGDVVRTIRPSPTLTAQGGVSTRQPVVTRTRWNEHGQVTESIDPLGRVTRFEYQGGYVSRQVTDADGLALTTTYEYDPRGNLTAVTNPRGVRTELTYNALNELVSIVQGRGEAGLDLTTLHEYDLDGRLVRTRAEAGLSPGTYLERTYVYDVLGDLRELRVQVDALTILTTRYLYDESRRLVEVVSPEGHQVRTEYDGSGLPFRVTHGFRTPEASSTTIDYDGNGNRTRVTDGRGQSTTFTYDGHDRLVITTDPLGGRVEQTFDPVGNAVRTRRFGHPPARPTDAPVLLAEVRVDHDELNRPYRSDAALLLGPGGPIESLVTTRVEYDPASRPVRVTEPDGRMTVTVYDGAGRVTHVFSPGGRVEQDHDANGNRTAVRSIEEATGGLVPTRTFTTAYEYDRLDRPSRVVDGASHSTTLQYDRRGRLVLQTDALGNVRTWSHDGLDRVRQEVRELREGGTGQGPPVAAITVTYEYDRDGRLTRVIDSHGRATTFEHDALGRRTKVRDALGREHAVLEYDRNGNPLATRDPNGTMVLRTFDALNRLVGCTVQHGPGVAGATGESYAYDGLSRLVRASSHLSPTQQDACEWTYDSLGRVVEERQHGQVVRSRYTPDGKRLELITPGRALSWTHDPAGRPSQLLGGTFSGAPVIASFEWAGSGLRPLQRQHANGTRRSYLEPSGAEGYDPLQRVTRLRDLPASGPALVDRTYRYDAVGNRTQEERHEVGGAIDAFTYDSVYRLVTGSFADGPRGLGAVSYQHDLVGNRTRVTRTSEAGATTNEVYSSNELHQYTRIGPEGEPGTARTYDHNGNLIADGPWSYLYDFKGRLAGVFLSAGSASRPVALYRYLPDGRRVHRTVFDATGTVVAQERRSLWDGPQEVEEQNEHGVTMATYVWAPGYVDELIQFQRTGAHPLGAGTFFVHQDARFNVVAVTDGSGIVERRRYDDFGAVEVRNGAGQVLAQTAVGLEYGFQGRRFDPETGLYFFRARYFDPATGRFMSRDPVWDPNNVGNPYTFAGNNPVTLNDPTGEIPPLLAAGIVAFAGAMIGGAVDLGVQAHTTAGFTAGEWDWRSTAKAAALEGATAPLHLLGGPTGGTIRAMVLRRGTQEIAGRMVSRGVMGELEQGSLGDDEWDDEEGEDFDNCFLAGTLVAMADGTRKPIEEVRAGDRVKAGDPARCEVVDREVVRTFRNVTDTVVDVTWAPLDRVECMAVGQRGRGERHSVGSSRDDGEGGEDGEPPSAQTVRCTPGHPWWVESQRRWRLAGDLSVGDLLMLDDGRPGVVLAVEVREEVAQTFNFEVEREHTYYVSGAQGQPGVLVHNRSVAWMAKRAAWAAYKSRAGTQGWSYRRWSRAYKTLAENRRIGQMQETLTGDFARRFGGQWDLVGSQVHVATRRGTRIVDHLLQNRANPRMLAGIEVKSGGAVRSGLQETKDLLLNEGVGRFFGRRAGDLANRTVHRVTEGRGIPTFVWNVPRLP
ncbi:MAG: choice-of-anchor D domain-containing protein [Planctomycetes bacterium]|nr:choice-of-anchor D domain-containing protein [Planctomycetota bacterium]